MNTISLSEWVGELESGARPKGGIKDGVGDIPSLGAEHLSDDGGFNFQKIKKIPAEFFRSMRKGHIKKYDILIVKDGATTGKVSFVNGDFPFEEAAINEHVFRLAVDERKADPTFVFRFLQTPEGQAGIMSDYRGATVGGIGRTFIGKVQVPDIDRNVQRRVAMILDKADAVRNKREKVFALADELLKSSFLKKFGDPVLNPHGFELKPLSHLLTGIDSGHSPRCDSRPAIAKEWGILKVSAVSSTVFSKSENKAVLTGYQPRVDHLIKRGDLLFARKNTYELVGATAIVEEDVDNLAMPDLIFRLVPNEEEVLIPYLWTLLTQSSTRERLREIASGAAGSMPNIGKARLLDFEIPVPNMTLQDEFSRLYYSILELKARLEEDSKQADQLFASLSQRSFRTGSMDGRYAA